MFIIYLYIYYIRPIDGSESVKVSRVISTFFKGAVSATSFIYLFNFCTSGDTINRIEISTKNT